MARPHDLWHVSFLRPCGSLCMSYAVAIWLVCVQLSLISFLVPGCGLSLSGGVSDCWRLKCWLPMLDLWAVGWRVGSCF